MKNVYLDIPENLPLFHGIEKDEMVSLLQCLTPKIQSYSKNETIVTVGESIDRFGLILEGEAMIVKENAVGNRVIMTVVKKGDLFGEMLVFSSHKTWPVSVRVQTSCKVLFLSHADLINRCANNCTWHTSMLHNFMKIISDKSIMLNKKVEYLSIKSIRGKICAYLLEQYQKTKSNTIILSLKRNELADFLNVSRPSMSRELCQMRDEGIIDFHLSTFKIKDLEAMKRFCDY